MKKSMKLTDSIMKGFCVARIFQENENYKMCLDFSRDGSILLVGDGVELTLYNCLTATKLCSRLVKCNNPPQVACLTPDNEHALHTSCESPFDFTIHCLDLNTGSVVRNFSGHLNTVQSLHFVPHITHQFISNGRDQKVRLWDRNTSHCIHQLLDYPNSLVACDPEGLVIAVSVGTQRIDIFDVRRISRNPCASFNYKANEAVTWTQMQFSPDGKRLLISTDNSWCFSVDAFNGAFCHSYNGYSNDKHLPLEATYTPDSQYILLGADDGLIHIWNTNSGKLVAILNGPNTGPFNCIRFNPKHSMFVSGSALTSFWLPTFTESLNKNKNYHNNNFIETSSEVTTAQEGIEEDEIIGY